ncbi:MAG: polysaccharide biosynthesis tyrosine autokinase [Bacilli bacterium]|nr:polysaccharide biosynthesis tyrosine autokinase [Bacilli bacterium]
MNNEEQLDFSYIMNTISKWFLLILLFAIIGLGGAFFYNYSLPLEYESKTTLYIEPQVNSSAITYEGILTNQRMAKTYMQIIKSRKIISKVIENLKLDLSNNEVLGMLTISSIEDTEMISIRVKSLYSEQSKNIANEIAVVFIEQIKTDMNINNITVVDEAIASEEPLEPSIVKNAIMGLGLGIIIGLLLSFIIESMDNKIKNHDDVKKYLKIKTLGVIPNNSIDLENDNRKKYTNPHIGADLKIITDPTSVVSESVRMIRTNLNFLDLKIINVLSTLPSEGKSEVISNLALSFAMLDKKVLIIDCDLRKPKIHKNFGLFRKDGVSDVVLSKGVKSLKETVQTFEDRDAGIKLDVLTAGSKVSNPSELINSKSFANLIASAKEEYDLVLIDCPPVSSITDGVLVSHLSDGTVYVIESERIDYQVAASCIEELKATKSFILGAILTKVNVKRQKKLYGYKYDYYYSNYNK